MTLAAVSLSRKRLFEMGCFPVFGHTHVGGKKTFPAHPFWMHSNRFEEKG